MDAWHLLVARFVKNRHQSDVASLSEIRREVAAELKRAEVLRDGAQAAYDDALRWWELTRTTDLHGLPLQRAPDFPDLNGPALRADLEYTRYIVAHMNRTLERGVQNMRVPRSVDDDVAARCLIHVCATELGTTPEHVRLHKGENGRWTSVANTGHLTKTANETGALVVQIYGLGCFVALLSNGTSAAYVVAPAVDDTLAKEAVGYVIGQTFPSAVPLRVLCDPEPADLAVRDIFMLLQTARGQRYWPTGKQIKEFVERHAEACARLQ